MAASSKGKWTEDELTLAIALYMRLPKRRIVAHDPDVQELAAAIGRTPAAVKMKLWNIGSCDEELMSLGRVSLKNGGALERELWKRYAGANRTKPLDTLLGAVELAAARLDNAAVGRMVMGIPAHAPAAATETFRLTRARNGQAFFRNAVLGMYEERCLVTGLEMASLIEVAHIVPWSKNESLRLVPANGLTLNPLIHRAYDANLLGIDGAMTVHVSSDLKAASSGKLLELFECIDGKPLQFPGDARPDPGYLEERHRDFTAHRVDTTGERMLSQIASGL